MDNNLRTLHLSGIAGSVGGLLLYVGDMLNYFSAHNPAPGGTFTQATLATLAQVESGRLIASGALGVICAWLYTIGAWQVYQALLPSGKRLAIITAGAFAALMIYMGQFHTAIVPYALGAKVVALANGQEALVNLATQLPSAYFGALLTVLVIPFLPFTIGFLYAVLRGGTRYPRWMALLTPSLLLVVGHALETIPPPTSDGAYTLLIAIAGGYANLSMLLFFAVSTVLLWNGGRAVNVQE